MILDYLKWRNDITFNERKFNNIDALIISRIAYMYLDEVFYDGKELPIKEVMKRYINTKDIENKTMWLADINLAKLLLKSKRYENSTISEYINVIDNKKEKQFSALVVKIDENTKIVSFRGTDNTVIGWKEDFNMSFEDKIPAQNSSVKYLNKVMEKSNEDIITVGHSKGGNLAIYSSIFVKDEYIDRIKEIYNFDGPGFNINVLNNENYIKLKNKIKTFIPEDAIVGIIMNRNEDYKVVKSNADYIMQHDVYTWELEIDDFKYLKDISKNSRLLSKSISAWLNKIDIKDRKEFVDLLFQGLTDKSLDLNNLSNNFKFIGKIIYRSITEPEIRDMLSKTFKIVFEAYQLQSKEDN